MLKFIDIICFKDLVIYDYLLLLVLYFFCDILFIVFYFWKLIFYIFIF